MGTITNSRAINAPMTKIWAILDDFANVDQWSRGVAKATALNGIKSGVGAERECHFDAAGKQWVKERVLERTKNGMVIDIYDTNAPMKLLRANITVRREGKHSVVEFKTDMKVKGGPLGTLMEVLMVRPQFNKAVNRLLEDLDTAARAA